MKNWQIRMRYISLVLATSGLFMLNGCGLSDRQVSSIMQSVIQTGLNAMVSNFISTVFSLTSAATA